MNITLYPLHDYNNGILSPFTIDLDTVADEDEYRQEIAKGLFEHSVTGNVETTRCMVCGHVHIASHDEECEECGTETVEYKITNEEWIVCDSEDVPGAYIGEYDLYSAFWAYKEFIENTHMDAKAVEAGLYLDIALGDLEEAYVGQYKDDEEFAYQLADDIGAVDGEAVWPQTCIDWAHAAREIMYDYSEHDGYYFRRV